MDNTTETNAPTIVPAEETPSVQDDVEARYKELEAEKENYRKAYLKEAGKNRAENFDEDTDEKMRQIARETLADSELARIAREQDAIIQRALKENKELKLAHLGKPTATPSSLGTHSESPQVTDTIMTPELMAYAKARNWTDKDIDNFKKSLVRKGGR